MPLYQPTNIFPSSFAGVGGGVVDVTQPLTVSWQVNGSSALTYYQIQVYENTTASNLVYNSGQTAVNPPFYGVTSTGEVQYFTTTIQPSALTGLSNGFSSGYKMLITQWWNGGSIQQISPSFFITRKDPTVQINSLPSTVTSRSVTLSATYTQAQGDTLDWFRWMLATPGDEVNPIEDSGYIYGTEDIQVTYDGLFTDTTYAVRCMIQTENGVQADTGWQTFNVQYTVSEMQGYVDACLSPVEGVVLQWPKISYIPGKPSGSNSVAGGQLTLPPGSSITWDERNGESLEIPEPWSLAWSGIVPATGTAPVWTVTGDGHTVAFNINSTSITLTLDGIALATLAIPHIVSNYTIRMVLTPREIHVYYPSQIGGLYPSRGLYPSPTLYPMAGSYTWTLWTYPLTWVQPAIESITLYGQQRCDYIGVFAGEVVDPKLSNLLTNFNYKPSWDLDTWFLATFDGTTGINGGNITPSGDSITGAAIYRLAEGDSKLSLVANVDIGTSMIVDEGFRNQTQYTYYVFVLGSNTYVSAPLASNAITPMFWNWTVLDCLEDDFGIYHVNAIHVFRNNVTTDRISNNNSPQMLQNFTPYPVKQITSFNYKSSILTGYIGTVDMVANQYTDTVAMAEALYSLSVSAIPKFLRDRKGNLWNIQTNSAVGMQTGDVQAQQPYMGTLPWAEVGPVGDASIIVVPGDGAWGDVSGEGDTTPDVAKIVVTAPVGSLITISYNGTITLSQTNYSGYVTYLPPSNGDYTVSATIGNAYDTYTVTVADLLTYYVGLIPTPFSATLVVTAPGGTVVTVSNGTYSFTGVTP